MPLILPGNVASATAPTTFSVANSCRFNAPDDPYMYKTLGTPTSTKIYTVSFWTKVSVSNVGTAKAIFSARTDASNRHSVWVHSAGALAMHGKTSGSQSIYLITTQGFKDPSAWYHIVIAFDTSQSTDTNRVKFYVNGTQITSFSTATFPDQDTVLEWGVASAVFNVGAYAVAGGVDSQYDGYLAEFVFIDGQQLTPTSFGEFDEDSPTIWKPKDVSGLTFGNNGFYLDFEASGNLGNDANGGTDLTEANLDATDQATDTPTNNFATLNTLETQSPAIASSNYSQGNMKFVQSASATWESQFATFGLTAGKWYWETKTTDITATGIECGIGVADESVDRTADSKFAAAATGYAYVNNGQKRSNDADLSYGDSFTDGDIISVALDITNLKIYFAKNGTWQDSGDPTSGATGTGAAYTIASGLTYLPAMSNYNSSDIECNFGGCPAFALSSAAADGNGYGAFEYAPPSGYLALCTKNLGSDGG